MLLKNIKTRLIQISVGSLLISGLSYASETGESNQKLEIPLQNCQTEHKKNSQPNKTQSFPKSTPVEVNFNCEQKVLSTIANLTEKGQDSKKTQEKALDSKDFDWNALIHDLAWPATVLFIALFFKSAIKSLIGRVFKFKYKDAELEFIAKEANNSLYRLAHGRDFGDAHIDAIFESVKFNDWATLVMARMLMRKGLLIVLGSNAPQSDSPKLEEMIQICLNQNHLPLALLQKLERLREVTYYAEWWSGRRPTISEWKWAVQHCREIVKELYDSTLMG